MKGHTRIVMAIPALLGAGLALMTLNTGRLVAQSDPVRQLYDDPDEFQKLSGAAQSLLELLYGKKTSAASSPSSSLFPSASMASRLFENPFALDSARSVLNGLLDELADNVLVNAVPDATAQDTQSETTLVLG